jgi:hypothetical protein
MTTATMNEPTIDAVSVLRAAPVWNVGNNVAQLLAWSDNIERTTNNERAKRVGQVLRGFAYILTGGLTVRPTVTRFVSTASPEQMLPWILRAANERLSAEAIVDFMNKNYHA